MYCTLDDLYALRSASVLAQLSNDTPGATTVNTTVVDQAIVQAQAEVDAYLGTLYQVPLAPVPVIIQSTTADLALSRLYLRREVLDEAAQEAADRGRQLLRDLSQGKATLKDTSGSTVESAPIIRSSKTVEDRVFLSPAGYL